MKSMKTYSVLAIQWKDGTCTATVIDRDEFFDKTDVYQNIKYITAVHRLDVKDEEPERVYQVYAE